MGGQNFHPGSSSPTAFSDAENWLKGVIDAVQESKYWNTSAIIIAFDEVTTTTRY
jgi:hypothetical protein